MTELDRSLETIAPNIQVRPAEVGVGLDLLVGNIPSGAGDAPPHSFAVDVSPVWSMGAWTIQFVKLGPGEIVQVDARHKRFCPKIILGSLVNPDRPRFAPPFEVRDVATPGSALEAGEEGALLAVMMDGAGSSGNIHSMNQIAMSGPCDELMQWDRFDQSHIGKNIPYFRGLDAHILPGFHLLDDAGDEIAYVHFWTAGKGVDMSAHDHSNTPSPTAPAFTETHFVLNNGTGNGGMYVCSGDDIHDRTFRTMQRGEEHGPYWAVNPETGKPLLRENGSIVYGLHSWQAGTDDEDGQAFDLVAAFELNPDYSKV